MGILNSLIGNSSEADIEKLKETYAKVMAEGEEMLRAYQLIRDKLILTNMRIIVVNVNGVTGTQIEYHSIPYRSIRQFCVTTAGLAGIDAELRLWIGSEKDYRQVDLSRGVDAYDVQRVITKCIDNIGR